MKKEKTKILIKYTFPKMNKIVSINITKWIALSPKMVRKWFFSFLILKIRENGKSSTENSTLASKQREISISPFLFRIRTVREYFKQLLRRIFMACSYVLFLVISNACKVHFFSISSENTFRNEWFQNTLCVIKCNFFK